MNEVIFAGLTFLGLLAAGGITIAFLRALFGGSERMEDLRNRFLGNTKG